MGSKLFSILLISSVLYLYEARSVGSCQEVLRTCFANAIGVTPLEQTSSVYRQLFEELAPNINSKELLKMTEGDPFTLPDGINQNTSTLQDVLVDLKNLSLDSKIPIETLNEKLRAVLVELAQTKDNTVLRHQAAVEAAARPLVFRLIKGTANPVWNQAGTLMVGIRRNMIQKINSQFVAIDQFGNEMEYYPELGRLRTLIPLNDGRTLICNQTGIFEMQLTDSKGKLIVKASPKQIYAFPKKQIDPNYDLDLLKLLNDGTTLRLHMNSDLILLGTDGKVKFAFPNSIGEWDQDDGPILIDDSHGIEIVSRLQINKNNEFHFKDLKGKTPNKEISIQVKGFPTESRGEFIHLLSSDIPGKIIGVYRNAKTLPPNRPILIEFDLKTKRGVIQKISGPLGETGKKAGADDYITPIPLKASIHILVQRGVEYFLLNPLTRTSKKFPLRQLVSHTENGEAFFSLVPKNDRKYVVVPYTNQLLLSNRATNQEFSLIDLAPLLKKYE